MTHSRAEYDGPHAAMLMGVYAVTLTDTGVKVAGEDYPGDPCATPHEAWARYAAAYEAFVGDRPFVNWRERPNVTESGDGYRIWSRLWAWKCYGDGRIDVAGRGTGRVVWDA